jgi:hypothetical protein
LALPLLILMRRGTLRMFENDVGRILESKRPNG